MDSSMTAEDNIRLAQRLEDAGIEDSLILEPGTFQNLFTDKRLELVHQLSNSEFESIRDLANTVDREASAVQKDLKQLYEHDVVTFEKQSNRKIPKLSHQAVLVEPIIDRGENAQ